MTNTRSQRDLPRIRRAQRLPGQRQPESELTITTKIPITVVIPTKNEELSIVECIEAVREFDQVVVVDSASPDRTQELALAAGAQVINYVWDGKYPKKKQWCLDNLDLRHDWVLFIDGDEKPSPELIRELADLATRNKLDALAAFDISLDYYFMGKKLRHGHQVVKRALVHRGRTHFPELDDLNAPGMGEQEGHYQPVASGIVGHLAGRIVHDDKDPFSTWITRHNRYSDWEAYLETHPQLAGQIQELRSSRGRRYRNSPLKPIFFFLYSYLLRRGFLDGRAGFNYALAHSFYFWQISVKRQDLQRAHT